MPAGNNMNNETVYICRAKDGSDMIPGKTKGLACHLPVGGENKKAITYEVLVQNSTTNALEWEDESHGNHGNNAVPGGYTCACNGETGQILYIGKTSGIISPDGNAQPSTSVIPGKISKCNQKLFYSFGQKEYHVTSYKSLVYRHKTTTTSPTPAPTPESTTPPLVS